MQEAVTVLLPENICQEDWLEMVYFVGAGPGAADLITVRGMRLLQKADIIIYAGSLVNPALLCQGRLSDS